MERKKMRLLWYKIKKIKTRYSIPLFWYENCIHVVIIEYMQNGIFSL